MHRTVRRVRPRLGLAAFAACTLALPANALVVYSLSEASSQVPGTFSADDVVDCFGNLYIPASALGSTGLEDVDALTFTFGGAEPGGGPSAFDPAFSVDSASSLAPGDVFASVSYLPGSNFLFHPAAGLAEQPGDDLNALDEFSAPPLFSLRVFSVKSGNSLGFSGADLLAPGATPTVLYSAADLGLMASDDVDAVHLLGGQVFFSLARGSASLGTFSAADIFVSDGTGSFARYLSAADLGLLSSDNIDGLTAFVPEPELVALLGLGGLAVLRRRAAAPTERE